VTTLLQVVDGPFAVALDIAGGKIYFASIGGVIQRANLDGSGQEILVRNENPDGIALDLAGGKMYWTNLLNGDIRRANLDGSGEEILIKGLSVPAFIALDLGAPGTAVFYAIAAPTNVRLAPLRRHHQCSGPVWQHRRQLPGHRNVFDLGHRRRHRPAGRLHLHGRRRRVHTVTGGVTLITPGDQTITATDTASGITRTATVTVVPPG